MIIIFGIIFLGIPVVLSVLNLIALFDELTNFQKMNIYTRLKYIDVVTIIVGVLFNIIFWKMCEFREYDSPIQVPLDLIRLHTPISSEHIYTVLFFFTLGYLSYLLLRFKYNDISPLIFVISISILIISNILGIAFIVQLSNHIFINSDGNIAVLTIGMALSLLPINFLILSSLLIREITKKYSNYKTVYNNTLLRTINQILIKSNKYFRISLILMFPLYGFLIGILVLFGQKPDSIILAFTQTSDWTLSQQISPPPVEVNAHYLCTVSLRGHRLLVKPVRYGMRRGNKIIVNRQLMIANAFEELIQELSPKMHIKIRALYDKYGYPLSNLITTKYKADITYILMKPLEYIFLIILYSFDKNPENRISLQYLPNDIRKSIENNTETI